MQLTPSLARFYANNRCDMGFRIDNIFEPMDRTAHRLFQFSSPTSTESPGFLTVIHGIQRRLCVEWYRFPLNPPHHFRFDDPRFTDVNRQRKLKTSSETLVRLIR
uniref:Uncharacterized protein n=1 Tax=Candidatus Kentrum sp. DK TaxID=2126562 RepID=A0A450S0J6_9GAMM|nr:MAG: hypothetical protein BECKDK2373C_GA0170839_101029 [Candidatus Kentron sp. DK]